MLSMLCGNPELSRSVSSCVVLLSGRVALRAVDRSVVQSEWTALLSSVRSFAAALLPELSSAVLAYAGSALVRAGPSYCRH